MKRILIAALFVLGVALASAGVAADHALPAEPIGSAEALEKYLRDAKASGSPLEAMPVGARRRFLASLRFRSSGVGGFDTWELEDTLTRVQIADVLALFGLQRYVEGFQGLDAPRVARQFQSEFEVRFNRFDATDASDAARLLAAFRHLLAGQDMMTLARALDAYDQALLYRATLRVIELDAVAELPAQAVQLLSVLRERGEAIPRRVQSLFDALVMARRFQLAEQLAKTYQGQDLPPLPRRNFDASDEPGPNAMLHVAVDGRELSRPVLDLAHGMHIVVVAGCHFAKEAATAISADTALDQLFREHAIWLAPQGEQIAAVAEWNREFPGHPIRIAWRERDWPQIKSWAMPTFHVFKDGKLLGHWSGWSAETGRATAIAELRKHGLLD